MEKLAIEGGEPVSEKPIPIAYTKLEEDEINAAVEVMRSGMLRQGKKVEEFEKRLAEKVGAKFGVAVSSGTAALHVAYMAMLEKGDEVIVPSFTFFATASTVIFSGGKPVFADVDERTFTLDPEDVKEKITPRTKAIAPVHLFGNSANIKALMEIAEDHGLKIIWDAAQALGTRYNGRDVGSYDDMVCYSFYPTKNLFVGEGGMIVTNSKELADKMRLLRSHGMAGKYNHVTLGLNYRMTDVEAAVGLEQLKKLDERIEKRRKNAEFLTKELSKIKGIVTPYVPKEVYHTFNQYSLLIDTEYLECSRDEFVNALRAENIGVGVHYPRPLHLQPVFKELLNTKEGDCPVSEELSKRIFSIPVHHALTDRDLELIVEAIKKVVGNYF